MSQVASVTVAIRVRPGASRTKVGGCYDGALGPALIVAVGAPAVDGRATEAVLVALARALGVRRRQVSLHIGQTSRDKVVAIVDPPVDVEDRLTRLRAGAK